MVGNHFARRKLIGCDSCLHTEAPLRGIECNLKYSNSSARQITPLRRSVVGLGAHLKPFPSRLRYLAAAHTSASVAALWCSAALASVSRKLLARRSAELPVDAKWLC